MCFFFSIRTPFYMIFLCFFSVLSQADSEEESLIREPLEDKMGYMLLELDINNVSSSLFYAPVRRRSVKVSKEEKLQLNDVDDRFILLALREGEYQITHVDVPLYNLPYFVDYKDDDRWRFKIERSRVNYIGKLIIEKERKIKTVYVRRVTRIAETLSDINKYFPDILSQYPLIHGGSHKDDFLKVLLEVVNEKGN